MNKKIIVIASIIVVVLLIALLSGYFYWTSYKKSGTTGIFGSAEDIANSAARGVLPSIGANPLENKPDVNPADKANPFTNIKTNPF